MITHKKGDATSHPSDMAGYLELYSRKDLKNTRKIKKQCFNGDSEDSKESVEDTVGGKNPSVETITRLESFRCEFRNCKKRAVFGMPSSNSYPMTSDVDKFSPPTHCPRHKRDGMIDFIIPRCQWQRCSKRPSYGNQGKLPIYCAMHKEEGMVDLKNRRCSFNNCPRLPTHGPFGGMALVCRAHRDNDMVDLKNRRCEDSGCSKWPTYGIAGERSRFCLAHKSTGMVDVKNRRCEQTGCEKRPTYGYEGERPRFCLAHKSQGMSDVRNRRCEVAGCSKRPNYGLQGGRSQFCLTHKETYMVDVMLRRCTRQGCNSRPKFGFVGRKPKYCEAHKEKGMVSVEEDHNVSQENVNNDRNSASISPTHQVVEQLYTHSYPQPNFIPRYPQHVDISVHALMNETPQQHPQRMMYGIPQMPLQSNQNYAIPNNINQRMVNYIWTPSTFFQAPNGLIYQSYWPQNASQNYFPPPPVDLQRYQENSMNLHMQNTPRPYISQNIYPPPPIGAFIPQQGGFSTQNMSGAAYVSNYMHQSRQPYYFYDEQIDQSQSDS